MKSKFLTWLIVICVGCTMTLGCSGVAFAQPGEDQQPAGQTEQGQAVQGQADQQLDGQTAEEPPAAEGASENQRADKAVTTADASVKKLNDRLQKNGDQLASISFDDAVKGVSSKDKRDSIIENIANGSVVKMPVNGRLTDDSTYEFSDSAAKSKKSEFSVQSDGAAAAGISIPTESRYDLRDKGMVTSVKDQCRFGSCWAFAAVAAFESSILKNIQGTDKDSLDLSEWQTVYNNSHPVNAGATVAGRKVKESQDGEYTGSGVNRGMEHDGAHQFVSGMAATDEKTIPYTNVNGTTAPNAKWTIPEGADRYESKYSAKDFFMVPGPNETENPRDGINNIKNALKENGALTVAFCADQSSPSDPLSPSGDYINYATGGHYISKDEMKNNRLEPNHAVTLVGWDDNFKKEDFGSKGKPDKDGAFLVKNSWGVGVWGLWETYENRPGESTCKHYVYTEPGATDPIDVFIEYNSGHRTYTLKTRGAKEDGSEDRVIAGDLSAGELIGNEMILTSMDGEGTEYKIYAVPRYKDSPMWEGYFWISYEDATICDTMAIVPEDDPSDAIYQYDYCGPASYTGMSDAGVLDGQDGNTVMAANVFEAEDSEEITAVSASARYAGSKVTADVYKLNEGAVGPTDGQKLSSVSDVIPLKGTMKLELKDKPKLSAGDRFSVVEKITMVDGQTTKGYLPIEVANGEGAARAGAGESFYSQDGGTTWKDATELKAKDIYEEGHPANKDRYLLGNMEIKAFANHIHSWETVVDKAAGKLSNGKQHQQCRCGAVQNYQVIPGWSSSYVKSFKLKRGKKSFTARWKKQSSKNRRKFNGYQLRYSVNSDMSGAITKNISRKSSAKKIKRLSGKQTYYVQLRSYVKKDGMTFYSKWSSKSVRTR